MSRPNYVAQCEFQASLGYRRRPCLSRQSTKNEGEEKDTSRLVGNRFDNNAKSQGERSRLVK